jgi:hypothetical protein
MILFAWLLNSVEKVIKEGLLNEPSVTHGPVFLSEYIFVKKIQGRN